MNISFIKDNYVFLRLITILTFILGIGALFSLTKEAFPSINIPNYLVTIIYPGADPAIVDQQVIDKLEKKLRSISLVKKVTTTSTFNLGVINIEFSETKKDADANNDIKAAIDQVYPSLPQDVRFPVVRKIDFNDAPIYTFSAGGKMDNQTLYKRLHDLEADIKSVQGVSDIIIVGKPQQQISILFNYDTLSQYNLDIGFVIQQLRTATYKIATDRKTIGGKLYSVELTNYTGSIQSIVEQLKNFPLVNSNGKVLQLSDFAQVVNGLANSTTESYIVQDFDPDTVLQTVAYQIKKIPGADIQKVTNKVIDFIEKFKKENTDIKIDETSSQKAVSERTFNNFLSNFWQTGLQVFLVILIFMGFRSGLVSLIGFVLVYAQAMLIFYATGTSFNNITSFSLILVLGIMVDNIVIIVEGTIEQLREGEKDIWKAISYSLKNYAVPIIVGTLATVFVFVPIQFSLKGIVGEFMKSFPNTVNTTLLISLLVTVIFVPVIIKWFIGPTLLQEEKEAKYFGKFLGIRLYRGHFSLFGKSLYGIPFVRPIDAIEKIKQVGDRFANKFDQFTVTPLKSLYVVSFFWFLFVSGIYLVASGLLKTDFLGNSDSDNVWINVEYNPGTNFEKNKLLSNEITKKLIVFLKPYQYGIESLTVDIGTSRDGDGISAAASAGGTNSNIMSFTLKLYSTSVPNNDGDYRSFLSYELNEKIQSFLDNEVLPVFPEATKMVALTAKGGPPTGKAISFDIAGENLDEIGAYVAKILPQVAAISGILNAELSVDYTNGKVQYLLDQNKIKATNLNVNSLAQLLSMVKNSEYRPNGIKITEFGEFGEDPVEVKTFLLYSGDISSIQVGGVYLRNITKKISLQPEIKNIKRVNGSKTITVAADKLTDVALGAITPQINDIIKKNPLPEGLEFKSGGDAESQSETGAQLGGAFLLGIVMMFLILVIQFKNLFYPTLILTSTLLSVAGGLFMLWILGNTFNFPSWLGMFGVIGVGVNQAIVIIDYIEELVQSGEFTNMRDALKKAIKKRFVPIFITNATGILGVLGVIFGDSVFGSLGITFMGGLLLSVFIGLWYVPAFLLLRESFQKKGMMKTFREGF